MDKIDNILNRLQEQRPVVPNPDELTERIMSSLPEQSAKSARRVWLYAASAIGIAATILLLLVFNSGNGHDGNTPTIAQQSNPQSSNDTIPAETKDRAAEPQEPMITPQRSDVAPDKHTGNIIAMTDKRETPQSTPKDNVYVAEAELPQQPTVTENLNPERAETKIFDSVEQMPSFPGGSIALMDYIHNNMRYPVLAAEYGAKGKVIMSFVVDKTGQLTDIKVVRNIITCDQSLVSEMTAEEQQLLSGRIARQLEDESIRLIKSMPKWQPGKQNGETKEYKYTLPIPFNPLQK